MQGFITDHERALEELFCESAEGFNKYNACLNTMATRISTVFASMRVCIYPLHAKAYVFFVTCFLAVPTNLIQNSKVKNAGLSNSCTDRGLDLIVASRLDNELDRGLDGLGH